MKKPHSSPPTKPTLRDVATTPSLLRTEVLAGLVVALALIPEAISFSIIAGVDPRVGLFASFTMAVSIAFLGGRPAMISAATGAVALVVAPVVKEHGLDYLFATVILAGLIQIALALLGAAKLMRFIPRSVMIGFVNALAILIFVAQLPHVRELNWTVYAMIAVGLAIIVLLPRVTTAVPAPLVAIAVLTGYVLISGADVPNVRDEGALPHTMPKPLIPDLPLTWHTLSIIGPYALAMALVGLLESLLTAKLVDDVTDTPSNKTREAWGQGGSNIISGFFGGLGGCAMIGQTMINVKTSGARTRLSTFLAGVFLLALVLGAGRLVEQIPMAALVAVMTMVAVGTMDWHSISPRTLRRMPLAETSVMLITVITVVATDNLAIGVVLGTLTAMVMFARRVAHLTEVTRTIEHDDDGEYVNYLVQGQLFFASSNDLYMQFAYSEDPARVVIDLSRSHVWDASTVAALDSITAKYERLDRSVRITGLNDSSAERHQLLTGRLATH